MQDTEVVHVYSYETGVSMELPVGFEQDHREANMAAYVDASDTDTEGAPRVVVRVVARLDDPGEGDEAVRQLVDAAAGAFDEVTERRTATVDGEQVATIVGYRTHPETGQRAVFHQSVAAVDDRLISVVGIVPIDEAAEMLPALDRAVSSIRFVFL